MEGELKWTGVEGGQGRTLEGGGQRVEGGLGGGQGWKGGGWRVWNQPLPLRWPEVGRDARVN